jgi:hypothetical protein
MNCNVCIVCKNGKLQKKNKLQTKKHTFPQGNTGHEKNNSL